MNFWGYLEFFGFGGCVCIWNYSILIHLIMDPVLQGFVCFSCYCLLLFFLVSTFLLFFFLFKHLIFQMNFITLLGSEQEISPYWWFSLMQNARCAEGQTQTVTRESSTITIAPTQGKSIYIPHVTLTSRSSFLL